MLKTFGMEHGPVNIVWKGFIAILQRTTCAADNGVEDISRSKNKKEARNAIKWSISRCTNVDSLFSFYFSFHFIAAQYLVVCF